MLSKSSNPVELIFDPVSKLTFDRWVNYAPGAETDEQVKHSAELCSDHMAMVPVHRLGTLLHSWYPCDVKGCEQVAEYVYSFNGVEQVEPEENA